MLFRSGWLHAAVAVEAISPPPVRRTLEKGEIASTATAAWSHPSATLEYTAEQLADIAAYVKWAAR